MDPFTIFQPRGFLAKEYKASDIKNLRGRLKLSQKSFAAWLNTSLNTVRSWEQGVRKPSHSALRLLEIFDNKFSSIEEIYKIEPKEQKVKKIKSQRKTIRIGSSERTSNPAMVAKGRH